MEAALPTVVRESHAQNHTQDLVTCAFGIGETLECDQRGTVCGYEPVGFRMERTRPPRRAERLQRCETEVQEQVIRTVDTTGEHHVGLAVMQGVAGQFDGVERRRARRVERVDRAVHLHGTGHQVHRQSRGEPVARIVITLAGPHRLDERGAHGAGIREVADDQAGTRRGQRAAERLLRALRQPRNDRIEMVEIGYPRSELGEIE